MSVVRVFDRGHVVFQETDLGCELPEPAILTHVDTGGTFVLQQEKQSITVNWSTLPELIGLLKEYSKRGPPR